MRTALVQLNVSDDPAANLPETLALVQTAAAGGAGFVLTPECTNLLSSNREHQRSVIRSEADDPTLDALRQQAAASGIWLLIGSLGLATGDADGRFANRSFLIAPDGSIAARYDKIHMFDVNVSETEVYRESAAYRPGARAVLAQTPFAAVGMTVCYDLRFPHLFRRLAKAGAQILTVPAAFNDTTGRAHWEVLLRARAIRLAIGLAVSWGKRDLDLDDLVPLLVGAISLGYGEKLAQPPPRILGGGIVHADIMTHTAVVVQQA